METVISSLQSTTRFSNRAENYMKYRPGYPPAVTIFLEQEFGLNHSFTIADIGSGTGLFAKPLLEKGYTVIGIEPNDEMRKKAEESLRHYANFTSYANTAEATGLEDESIDLITVAQAFHWLHPEDTRKEFNRILKPGGHTVMAWNIAKRDTAFLHAYAELKNTYGLDKGTTDRNDISSISHFFEAGGFKERTFPNVQLLDFEALKGQLLSVSYMPLPGHTSYETMISSLIQLFVACNENGFVRMEFETKLYWGH